MDGVRILEWLAPAVPEEAIDWDAVYREEMPRVFNYFRYRGFDRGKAEPLFPFGHGLSYTTFEYGGLTISPAKMKAEGKVEVGVQVRNTGPRAGAEVVEVYVHDVESSLPRPEKELKAFGRVMLQPGESRALTFTLDRSALQFFDPGKGDWVAEKGAFEVRVEPPRATPA